MPFASFAYRITRARAVSKRLNLLAVAGVSRNSAKFAKWKPVDQACGGKSDVASQIDSFSLTQARTVHRLFASEQRAHSAVAVRRRNLCIWMVHP